MPQAALVRSGRSGLAVVVLGLGLGLALGLGPHDVEGVLGGCGMLWHSVGRVRRIVAWCWECHNVP